MSGIALRSSLMLTNIILPFFIAFIFISYIRNLEKKECNCSENVRRKYVKYYGYFFLTVSILTIICVLSHSLIPGIVILNDFIKYITLVINLLAAYVLYEYSDILENADCKCSDSWKRVFIKYYSYFLIFTMSLIFFSLLMIFMSHIIFQEDQYIYLIKYLLRSCKM